LAAASDSENESLAMSTKTLRRFQELAVESGVDLFLAARDQLDAAGSDAAGRAAAINHNGYLLIEAPTGSGKTLMAGTMVERFSAEERVVWFWFAPFKGVVGQTAAFLREQFHGLRLRELSDDRATDLSRAGDVFVTTWQTVVTRVKDKRNVRKEGETNPSIDTLIEQLRTQGYRIGVVVDEAHHGFGDNTQASKFFREVLMPEYTILITATPDDADVKAFEKGMGIAELHRVRVSREDAVDSGLIKRGVRCAAYFVDPDKVGLVDLEGTALRDGVLAHRGLKLRLAEMKISLVPLLLVQVTSEEKSVEKAKEKLLALGFTDDQIAIHTADEPDPSLLALANDERREVLIFKMAVALGFDAPRAFTLVSMRASRDAEFGVQLVGRILRVHRLLQGRARARSLPEELNYGYVFLASPETQTGLDIAGQKINAIQTEYAKVSTATVALRLGEGVAGVSKVDSRGQMEFFGLEGQEIIAGTIVEGGGAEAPVVPIPSDRFALDFGKFFGYGGVPDDGDAPGKAPKQVAGLSTVHRYALRAGVPHRFKTQRVCADNEVTEEDCAERFVVSTREVLDAMRDKIPVERRTLDVFLGTMQQEFDFDADLSVAEAARRANNALLKNKSFDARELRRALLRKLSETMRKVGIVEADDPAEVAHFLNVILATHPERLWEAQKQALRAHSEIVAAEDLPSEIVSEEPLAKSPRNLYQVMPSGLNGWEREFAELLDRDPHLLVAWWHRNPSDKPWSVNVQMPNGKGFYPDFIIGIEGRATEDGALLADPKERFETSQEAPKVLAEHRLYGRVLILAKEAGRWMTVGFDEKAKKPVFAKEFRLADAPDFGMAEAKALVVRKDKGNLVETESVMTGIEKTPKICGGDACIADSRVPVWLLVQARNVGFTDEALLKQYPALTQQDLDAAWAYATAEPAEIAAAIRANEEA
jgi:type III restriction enzyme